MKEVIYLDSINSCIILEMFPGNRFDVIDTETYFIGWFRIGNSDELLISKAGGNRLRFIYYYN
jgi:hypothetical protein